ncbi:hypothetical protein N9E11_01580 [Crocinitomicaceae bacterium]|nr:hypothetical protein [Crocinitomicaceae bacterium]
MGLFSKKENTENNDGNENNPQSSQDPNVLTKEQILAIETNAQQASIMQGGNEVAFDSALKNEASQVKHEMINNTALQEKQNKDLKIKLTELTSKKEALEKQVNQIEDKVLKDLDDKITRCDFEKNDAQDNPTKYGIDSDPDPSTKSLFYIGCIILAAVGVFLAIFYMSATYSAFFKDWGAEGEMGITSKIFDSQAFVKAWQQSTTAGLLVSLSVFIFLGLGVLLHVFQKEVGKAKWIKVAAIIVITLIFDVLLAYFIEYQVQENNATLNSEEFGVKDAIESIQFWIIIFFGFVTYIIWGLVFDFTMDKWSKFSPLRNFISKKEDEKKKLERKKEETKLTQDKLEGEIAEYNISIDKIDEELKEPVISKSHLKTYIDAYAKGWIFGIAACAISEDIKDKRRTNCQIVLKDFRKSTNIV